MRTRLAVPALLAFALAACSDSTGPSLTTTSVTLHICPSAVTWVGYQNQGAGWLKVTMSTDGEVIFDATDKVSFAWVISSGSISIVQVLNTTSAELLSANDLPCEAVYGSRAITGTVTGLTGQQAVVVTGAYSVAGVTAANSAWTLQNLPSAGGIDVIAVRYPGASAATPDRVIVRRGVVPLTYGMAIPTLDFASNESLALETATATLANVGSDQVQLETSVWTVNNTRAQLEEKSTSSAPYVLSYASLPAALRIDVDIHRMYSYAISAVGYREVVQYYKTPANRTVTFGPALSTPTVTQIATTPYPRARATFASQPEYSSGARAVFYQYSGQSITDEVVVTTTADHLGGAPATWTIEIPDFGASAFQPYWGLSSGSYYWYVQAYEGLLRYEGRPADGAMITSALRFGSIAAAQQSARARNMRPAAMGWR